MDTKLAALIIDYQKKTDKNDAQMAFESHFSVEKIHDIKAGRSAYTPDEEKRLVQYINDHPSSSN